jgi:hypothetical protein
MPHSYRADLRCISAKSYSYRSQTTPRTPITEAPQRGYCLRGPGDDPRAVCVYGADLIHELQQVLFADTPKGLALIKFMIIEGIDSDILWVTAIQETGECWTFSNEDIRFAKNLTIGRRCTWEKANPSRDAE